MKEILRKTTRMKQIQIEQGESIEEVLRQRFVDEGKALHDIADELGIQYYILIDWLKRAGVYSRRLHIV